MQVRLKDAGFDVGPVDGVMGFKTKSALLRFQSGCTMVKDLPAIFENQVQTSDRMQSPMSASEKQIQPTSKAPSATGSVRDEAGKVNAAADNSQQGRNPASAGAAESGWFRSGPFRWDARAQNEVCTSAVPDSQWIFDFTKIVVERRA